MSVQYRLNQVVDRSDQYSCQLYKGYNLNNSKLFNKTTHTGLGWAVISCSNNILQLCGRGKKALALEIKPTLIYC